MNAVINNLMKKNQGTDSKDKEKEEEKKKILCNKLIYYSKINNCEKSMELLE